MAYVDWSIKGPELASCNCDWGCPCQFNSRPTHGNCRASTVMRIDEGHFGDVRLDGLLWAGTFAWPGAIHEGNGEAQIVLDERSDEKQRDALFTILKGEETEPGATIFNVFSTVIETVHPPLFKHIDLEIDMEARTGHAAIDGVIDVKASPITNPVSGEPHRARVILPHGFEYTEAEYASSWVQGKGAVHLGWVNGHSHLAMLHLTPTGPVR